MKGPPQEPRKGPLTDAERRALTARAVYVGSAEHKAERWWGGLPGVHYGKNGEPARYKKQKTTVCHLVSEADRDRATAWIRAAIEEKQYRFLEGGAARNVVGIRRGVISGSMKVSFQAARSIG